MINTTSSVLFRIVLWIVLIVGEIFAGVYIDMLYFKDIFLNPFWHIISFVTGFVLLKLAFKSASRGGKELAKSGRSKNLPRLETDKLVTSGIYQKMRHPMLLGLTLLPLAIAFLTGLVSAIVLIAPLEMIFIIVMVLTLEERECRVKFGNEYIEYASKVPPVCLKTECLKELFGFK